MKRLTALCMLGLIVLIIANTDSVAAPTEDTAKKCSDGRDNDRDGFIDADDHPDCDPFSGGGGGGGGGTGGNIPQKIGVHRHIGLGNAADLWRPTDLLSTCVMQKNSGNSLSGSFPRHALCATLTTNSGLFVSDDIIVIVNANNGGVVQDVQVQGQDVIGTVGIVHISDVVEVDSVDRDADGNVAVIHVHADNVNLHKCDTHVLKRKSVCNILAGVFSIHDLVFSADDP